MQHDCTSSVHDTIFKQPYPLASVPAPQVITPIASHSEMTNKRTFYDAMEIKQQDNSDTFNLAMASKNKVVDMTMNSENINVPETIHLHKKTGEVIYNDC